MRLNLSWRLQRYRAGIPYFVGAIALLFTATAASYVAMTAHDKEQLQFENTVRATEDDILEQVEAYTALLRAGSGLFAASENVSREEFRAFVDRFKLRQRYPGVQGIGLALRVSPEAKAAFEVEMRQQGLANSIKPNFPRREYFPVTYLEPLDRRNQAAIGFDMFSESVRQAAMERARDTGNPAASGKVTLIQEIDGQKQAGFLIYLPIYRNGSIPNIIAERRATLLGFVYSPFRADDLIQGIFSKKESRLVDFQIYDGSNFSPANLLHSSSSTTNNPSYQPRFNTTRSIDVAGRRWSIVFSSQPELEQTSERGLVPYMVLTGVGMTLILFGVTRSLADARSEAEQSAVLARSSETALRQSEERYRAFIEKSSEGIWRFELEQPLAIERPEDEQIQHFYQYAHLAECNNVMAQMYGFSRAEELAGARLADFLVESDPLNVEYLRSFIRSGYNLNASESYEVDKEGQPKYFLNNLVGIVENGFLVRAWGTQLDITERKQAEAERENLLEREQSAREEAERANRMKDEFLATLSHELRTPLNAMMGWTQLLRSRNFNEATRARALETIDRNTKTLAQLIEDILDMSRIIRGKLHLNMHAVELIPTIEAAIETVLPAAQAKEITIQFVLHPAVGPVLGDANRLQQVFWNLLANAVKFTPKGGEIEVRLSTVIRNENDQIPITHYPLPNTNYQLPITNYQSPITSYAQIQVRDSGIGISPEFLPYVFERFRQADSTTTRSYGGLGLGLSIVRHLVELHGGTVHAESPGLGKGATFTVHLPLKAADSGSESELRSHEVEASETRAIAQPILDGLRILVVDDEADARDLLATVPNTIWSRSYKCGNTKGSYSSDRFI